MSKVSATPPIQDLFRKVRSILNKLTPQKFNQLMEQVTDLTIDTEERLKGVIDLVFEKAIDEPSFSVAYANMCRCLATVTSPMNIWVRRWYGVAAVCVEFSARKLMDREKGRRKRCRFKLDSRNRLKQNSFGFALCRDRID